MCCSEESLEMLVVWYELECVIEALDEDAEAIQEAA